MALSSAVSRPLVLALVLLPAGHFELFDVQVWVPTDPVEVPAGRTRPKHGPSHRLHGVEECEPVIIVDLVLDGDHRRPAAGLRIDLEPWCVPVRQRGAVEALTVRHPQCQTDEHTYADEGSGGEQRDL